MHPAGNDGVAEAAGQPWPRPAYAWYVVVVLMLAYTNSFIDRQILTLLIEPIRRDLEVSDTQVSLLAGLAFSIFYSVMGIPLARLADQKSRIALMTAGLGAWSAMTVVCGLARNFWQLFLARVGVGVGEAALSPAAFSLLSDYFPRHRLARAVSVYSMGVYFGAGLALMIGGLVIQLVSSAPAREFPVVGRLFPWQLTFVVVGLLGLPVLALMLTVREPVRRGLRPAAGDGPGGASSLGAFATFLRANLRTVTCHFGGFSFFGMAIAAYLVWTPSFLIRTYGWEPAQVGWTFGALLLGVGTAGVYAGGYVADRLARAGRQDATLRAALYAELAVLPFAVLTPLMPGPGAALVGLSVTMFLLAFPQGLPAAALQVMTPNPLRAQVSALYFFVGNLIANGLGPTVVALVTDFGFRDPSMLRYSMSVVCAVTIPVGAALLYLGLAPYRASVSRATNAT
jgi:MFS family permease